MKYSAKRIQSGHYKYRGFDIRCLGYYSPDQKVIWEATDKYGSGYAQSHSLKETKWLLDLMIEKRKQDVK